MTRGHVTIMREQTGEYVVWDWSEHFDSGGQVGSFRTRAEAERIARAWADAHNRRFETADIIELSAARRAGGA